jgi:hypothetical protein
MAHIVVICFLLSFLEHCAAPISAHLRAWVDGTRCAQQPLRGLVTSNSPAPKQPVRILPRTGGKPPEPVPASAQVSVPDQDPVLRCDAALTEAESPPCRAEVYTVALDALRRLRSSGVETRRAAPMLRRHLLSADRALRRIVARTIVSIDPTDQAAVSVLIGEILDREPLVDLQILWEMLQQAALDPRLALSPGFWRSDWELHRLSVSLRRGNVLVGLRSLQPSPAGRERLVRVLTAIVKDRDEDPDVRATAREVLSRWQQLEWPASRQWERDW